MARSSGTSCPWTPRASTPPRPSRTVRLRWARARGGGGDVRPCGPARSRYRRRARMSQLLPELVVPRRPPPGPLARAPARAPARTTPSPRPSSSTTRGSPSCGARRGGRTTEAPGPPPCAAPTTCATRQRHRGPLQRHARRRPSPGPGPPPGPAATNTTHEPRTPCTRARAHAHTACTFAFESPHGSPSARPSRPHWPEGVRTRLACIPAPHTPPAAHAPSGLTAPAPRGGGSSSSRSSAAAGTRAGGAPAPPPATGL
jgi:hypothetical protein